MDIVVFDSYTPYGNMFLATNLALHAKKDATLESLVYSAKEMEPQAIWASHHLKEAARSLMTLSQSAVDVTSDAALDLPVRVFSVQGNEAKGALRSAEAFVLFALTCAAGILDRIERIHVRLAKLQPSFWTEVNFTNGKIAQPGEIWKGLYSSCDSSSLIGQREWPESPTLYVKTLHGWRCERVHEKHYTVYVRRPPLEVLFTSAPSLSQLFDPEATSFTAMEVLTNLIHLDHFMEWWVEEVEARLAPLEPQALK